MDYLFSCLVPLLTSNRFARGDFIEMGRVFLDGQSMHVNELFCSPPSCISFFFLFSERERGGRGIMGIRYIFSPSAFIIFSLLIAVLPPPPSPLGDEPAVDISLEDGPLLMNGGVGTVRLGGEVKWQVSYHVRYRQSKKSEKKKHDEKGS